MTTALRDIAQALAAAAQRAVLIQRDPRRPLPSRLAESIHVVAVGDAIQVVASADHAVSVEFGTRSRPARPFMRLAIEQVRQSPGSAT